MYFKNMSSKNIKKIAVGVLLIWAFFACYSLAESTSAVHDSHENDTKTCELGISLIQQGIATDGDKTHILMQPSYIIQIQTPSHLPPFEEKGQLSFSKQNPLRSSNHSLLSVLRI